MRKKRTDKLKEHQKRDPIPWDFWNYNINIILGYKYKPTIIKKIDWKKYKNDSTIK
jgi:hypothetical protein